ncbi:MAG: hypothetical protein AB1776_06580 [Bacillota bacterium]
MALKRMAARLVLRVLLPRLAACLAERWHRQLRDFFSLSNLFGEGVATWWRMRRSRQK